MILFYLMIGIMPLMQHPFWAGQFAGTTVTKFVGLTCCVYAVYHVFSTRRVPTLLKSWQERCFLVLLVIAVASYISVGSSLVFVAINPVSSYTSFALLLPTTLILVDSARRLRRVLAASVMSIAYASLYVLREWQKYHAFNRAGWRPGWIVGDPNYFAVAACIVMPAGVLLLIHSRSRWEKVLYGSCTILGGAGIIFSGSRGGFLGLIAALAFAIAHLKNGMRYALLGAIVLLPVTAGMPNSPVNRLLRPTQEDTSSVDIRKDLWRTGLRMIEAHPLTGVGLGNFMRVFPQYSVGDVPPGIPCNSYIEVAAELGIPAMLVYVAILYFSCSNLQRVRRRALASRSSFLATAALAIQSGLLGFAVASFVESVQYVKFVWLYVFLSAALSSILREHLRRQPKVAIQTLGTHHVEEFSAIPAYRL